VVQIFPVPKLAGGRNVQSEPLPGGPMSCYQQPHHSLPKGLQHTESFSLRGDFCPTEYHSGAMVKI